MRVARYHGEVNGVDPRCNVKRCGEDVRKTDFHLCHFYVARETSRVRAREVHDSCYICICTNALHCAALLRYYYSELLRH